MRPGLYYHTLRYLRPIQFYGRLSHRLRRPRPDLGPPPAFRNRAGDYPLPPVRPASMLAPDRFRFLNLERTVVHARDWNAPDAEKLWLYNLHYFDDLNAEGCDERQAWHHALIQRWIAENPPGHGNGWEPYPISLRLVNWIKWAMGGHKLPTAAVQSLAIQARYLTQRLEYHLLGNHLWTNGKALLFAGLFFEGEEADQWRQTGMAIVAEQLAEQLLPDGGHFERSPMYHSIFIEDLLDLVAVAKCFPGIAPEAAVEDWRSKIAMMLDWLAVMTHPDGDIALFNDAAPGLAASPERLRFMAGNLGVACPESSAERLQLLAASGYVRMNKGDFVVIADVGPIGPDYIPGHAHADTLSFELSWRGRRVFGNSGTSCYGTGPQRQRERGTAAHNTVMVDGEDSSEVWHGFRVARRARPTDLQVSGEAERLRVSCEHDGYTRLRGRPMHRREWRLDERGLVIRDEIQGRGQHRAVGHLHVQPGIQLQRIDERILRLSIPGLGVLQLHAEAPAALEVVEGFHAPAFGLLRPRPVITWQMSGRLPLRSRIELEALG